MPLFLLIVLNVVLDVQPHLKWRCEGRQNEKVRLASVVIMVGSRRAQIAVVDVIVVIVVAHCGAVMSVVTA